MLIVGSGPIGCELGQGFARLGTQVTMIERGNQFLPREDSDCVIHLQEQMKSDGVKFMLSTHIKSFEKVVDQVKVTYSPNFDFHGEEAELVCDVVLLATGRVPNIENMGLIEGLIGFSKEGVTVNDQLQTTNENVYAVGDCIPGHKFTHNSDIHARYVTRNALLDTNKELKSNIILPYTTYTDPEIGSVGMNETALKSQGIKYETYTKFFDRLDRATCEGKTKGIYKVHCREGTQEILGATLVGGPAGDMVCQIT